MVKIRLMRMGKRKQPYYRVVVADARSPRDGRFIENIGRYHPRAHPSVIDIDRDRALHWLRNGAQPSDPVRVLLEKTGIWGAFTGQAPAEEPAPSPPPDEGAVGDEQGAAETEPAEQATREGGEEAP
jgi:small subunit ribosomal protein S16